MSTVQGNQKKSYRMMFRFWLDAHKPDESELADYAEYLKSERSFVSTVRDALNLIQDLRRGRVDVLLALFPWIAEYFANQQSNDPIHEQLKRLETLMLQQGNIPIREGELPSKPRLPAVTKGDQAERDIAIEIKKATADTENNPAFNFAITTAPLNGGYETLPPEVLEYGLRTGKIPSGAVKPKSKLLNAGNGAGNAKKMDVPALAAPIFDDDDDSIDLF